MKLRTAKDRSGAVTPLASGHAKATAYSIGEMDGNCQIQRRGHHEVL